MDRQRVLEAIGLARAQGWQLVVYIEDHIYVEAFQRPVSFYCEMLGDALNLVGDLAQVVRAGAKEPAKFITVTDPKISDGIQETMSAHFEGRITIVRSHDLFVEANPELTQAGLAAQLGVAVGSVNWYLKRLVHKGYIKVSRLQWRKLKYFVTPEGLAFKAHLTVQYMKASLRVYRELRAAAREALVQVRQAGYSAVLPIGQGEAMEIFRLTCLEEGIQVAKEPSPTLAEVRVEGTRFAVLLPTSHLPNAAGPERQGTP